MTLPVAPRYIVIEGPIGVGKTTLAESLRQRLKARLILESFEENPFLPLFYQDRDRYAFQTEIFFLLSRHRQQASFHQDDLFAPYTISDYLFRKCRIFASLNLQSHEMELFDQVYSILEDKIPRPDLIVYLHAPTDVLLERISQRGRSYEKTMEASYLEQLRQAYLHDLRAHPPAPVLSVDTTSVDLRNDDNLEALLQAIKLGRTGRLEPEIFPSLRPPLFASSVPSL